MNPALKEFDSFYVAYHSGTIGIGAYVEKMDRWASDDSSFVLDRFLEAYKLEKNLDFSEIEKERELVSRALAVRLRQTQMDDLLRESLAFKEGQVSYADHYRVMRGFISQAGVPIREIPSFNKYIQYVLLSDGVKSAELFGSVKSLEARFILAIPGNGGRSTGIRFLIWIKREKSITQNTLLIGGRNFRDLQMKDGMTSVRWRL